MTGGTEDGEPAEPAVVVTNIADAAGATDTPAGAVVTDPTDAAVVTDPTDPTDTATTPDWVEAELPDTDCAVWLLVATGPSVAMLLVLVS